MNKLIKFFHELRNPHCEHCQHERIESNYCNTCEVLRIQLALSNQRIGELINQLSNKPTNEQEAVNTNIKQNVIQTRHIPWSVKKQMLESESRAKALAMSKAAKPDIKNDITEKLEEDLGISDARSSS